jgi:phage/plasmid-like protein (TIGR03299 family)
MAANLNYNKAKGRYAFATCREKPWHGLGVIVDNRMTSKECIELASLDYEVGKGKLFVKYDEPLIKPDGTPLKGLEIVDQFATYRKDTGYPFGIVGSQYSVIQNKEAFEFFDHIVGERRAIYETAGALGHGETIFITAKLPDHILIGGKDTIDQYILLTMSHDGTGSIIAKFTPIRVVCNNTLSAALSSGSNVFKLKHTRNVKDRLKEAEELLAITYKTSKETQEIYNHLITINIDEKVKTNYFLDIMLDNKEINTLAKEGVAWYNSQELSTRRKNQLEALFTFDNKGVGQDTFIGTAYNAYNAITGYVQNVKNYADDEKKFSNIMMGADGKLIERALVEALNLEFV